MSAEAARATARTAIGHLIAALVEPRTPQAVDAALEWLRGIGVDVPEKNHGVTYPSEIHGGGGER